MPVVDPLVKVYDVRTLRPLPPITFPALPAFIASHPRNSNTLFIASAQGQLQIADFSDPLNAQFLNIETDSYLTNMAISATGEALMFSDADSVLHMWSSAPFGEHPRCSRADAPLDVPERPEPPRQLQWSAVTPLSEIGMPYYNKELLSVIPWQCYSTPFSTFGQPPRKIDPAILASMKQVDFVGYAINPRTTLRNQAFPRESAAREAKRKVDVPLFRSEKQRAMSHKRRTSSRGASKTVGCATQLTESVLRFTHAAANGRNR